MKLFQKLLIKELQEKLEKVSMVEEDLLVFDLGDYNDGGYVAAAVGNLAIARNNLNSAIYFIETTVEADDV